MKLSQIYQILGWPLRFWRTKTLPPAPPAHNVPFDEIVRGLKSRRDPAAAGDPKQGTTDQEFKELVDAMDARYYSLKSGESLGRLSSDELRELHAMETGGGWCLNLTNQPKPERLGMRSIIIP